MSFDYLDDDQRREDYDNRSDDYEYIGVLCLACGGSGLGPEGWDCEMCDGSGTFEF